MVGMAPDFLQNKIRTDARPLGELEISVNNSRELGQRSSSQGSLKSSKVSCTQEFGVAISM